MDKQKQIEEIAWIIQNGCSCSYGNGCEFKDNNFKKIYDKRLECENISRAIKIYDFLIPKGSVVLTEEQFNEFRQTIITQSQEYTKLCDEMNTKIINARKQAIEEYAEKLHSSLDKSIPALNGVLVMLVKNIVDNTAKELGVKLHESVETCKNAKKRPNFENHTGDPDWN